MAMMELARNQELSFLVPEEEGKGVRRIAVKVAKDVEKTLGMHTAVRKEADVLEQAVLAVTAGRGEIAGKLEERLPELCGIKGKWEVYGFHLSELLGVSACCFWGDAGYPSYEKKILISDKKSLDKEDIYIYVENGISKEPSVKYRGFCKRRRKSIWGRMELSDK